MRPEIYDHPERKSDEIFLGNFAQDEFMRIGWNTKRMGFTAYDIYGEVIPQPEDKNDFISMLHGIYPAFVLKSEVKRKLDEAKITHDQIGVEVFTSMLNLGYYK